MQLTSIEFGRGVLFWDNLQTRVKATSKAQIGSAAPIEVCATAPEGSPMPFGLRELDRIGLVGLGMDTRPAGGTVRWLWADEEGLGVQVWDIATGRQMAMSHVLGWGVFHRLVVFVPHLLWREDRAFVYPDLVIRFTRTFSGERVQPLMSIEDGANGPEGVGYRGFSGIHEGAFIDIVVGKSTPAMPPDDSSLERESAMAASRAFSIWGLLIFQLGGNAMGSDVVLSATNVGHCEDGLTSHHLIELRAQSSVEEHFPLIEEALERWVTADETPFQIALRWYERGRNATDQRDRLLAFSHGIEAIVREPGKQAGVGSPLKDAVQDGQLESALAAMDAIHSETVMRRIRGRLTTLEPAIKDYVEHFREAHALPGSFAKDFAKVNRLRNPAAHGGSKTVTRDDSYRAQQLLETILSKTLLSVDTEED